MWLVVRVSASASRRLREGRGDSGACDGKPSCRAQHRTFGLKEAAARHGRIAEAEHREILRAALTRRARRSFNDVLAAMPDLGTDEDFDFRQP